MSSVEDIGNSSANSSFIRQHPKSSAIKGLEALLQTPKKKYEDRVAATLSAWEILSHSGNSREIFNEFADRIHRDTLLIVLQGEWPSLPAANKTHLTHLVQRCANLFASHHSAHKHRTLVQLLEDDPWGHPSLKRILTCEKEDRIDDNEAIKFCTSETSSILIMRLDVLASSKCEDIALKLARIFVRCLKLPGSSFQTDCPVEHRNQIIDYYVALLYKFKLYSEIIDEVLKDLSVEDGLELVERHSGFSSANSRLWKQSYKIALLEAHYLVTTAFLKQESVENPKMKPLIVLWLSLHKKSKTSPSNLASILKQIILATKVSHHIYNLCNILREEFEEDMKPLIIELFIHGLTLDLNEWQKIKLEDDAEKTKMAEISLSNGFLHLANVLKDNISISREFVLTAFTLNPTEENYTKVADLAALCQQIKIESEKDDNELGVVICTNCDSGGSESCVRMECDSTTPHGEIVTLQEQNVICPKCGSLCPVSEPAKNELDSIIKESSAFDLANYDVLSAATYVLVPSKLGISQQLCDDLYAILKTSRWQVLHWLLDWSELKSLCAEIVKDPTSRLKVKELKHLKPDFSQQPLARLEIDEYYGIEEGYEYLLDEETTEAPKVGARPNQLAKSAKPSPVKSKKKTKDIDLDYSPVTPKFKRIKKKMPKRTVLVDTSDESNNELQTCVKKLNKPKLGVSGKKSLKIKTAQPKPKHAPPLKSLLKVPDNKNKKSLNDYVASQICKKATSNAQLLDPKLDRMAMMNSERCKGVLECLRLNHRSRAPTVVSTDSEDSSDGGNLPKTSNDNSPLQAAPPRSNTTSNTGKNATAALPAQPSLPVVTGKTIPSASIINSPLPISSKLQQSLTLMKETLLKPSALESLLRSPLASSPGIPNNISIEFPNKNLEPAIIVRSDDQTLKALRNFRPSERESPKKIINNAPSLSDINLHPKILLPKMPNTPSKSDIHIISGTKSQTKMDKVLNVNPDKEKSRLKRRDHNVLSSIPGMRTLAFMQPRQTNTYIHVVQTSTRGAETSQSSNNQGSSQVPKPTSDSNSSAPTSVVTSVVHHTSAAASQLPQTTVKPTPASSSSPQTTTRVQLVTSNASQVTSVPSSTITFASIPSSSGSSVINTAVSLPLSTPTNRQQQVNKTPVSKPELVNNNASAKNPSFTSVPVANPLNRIVVTNTPQQPVRQNTTPNAVRRPPSQGLPKFNQAFGKPSYQADTPTLANSTTVKTAQAAAASGSIPAQGAPVPILVPVSGRLVQAVPSNATKKRAVYVTKEIPTASLTISAEDVARLRANTPRYAVTSGGLAKPVAETSVQPKIAATTTITTQVSKIASTDADQTVVETTTPNVGTTTTTAAPLLKTRIVDPIDSSSEDSNDSSLTALNHLPSVSSSTPVLRPQVNKTFNLASNSLQTIIGGTMMAQSTQTTPNQPTLNSSPPLSSTQDADLTEQLKEFESILQQQYMKGQSQTNESEPVQQTAVIRSTLGQTQQFVARPSTTTFGSELLALTSNTTNTTVNRATTTIASTPVQRVLTYVAQAGTAATTASTGAVTRVPHHIPLVVVTSYSQSVASPALSVTSQSSSSPCVTPAGTPSAGKTIASKTAAVKTQKPKTVKTSTATSSKAAPVAKPQQKPQEDEETVQRIYAILGEYAEKLRNSPDLNNKPAPRRRSNPPTNAAQSSKRKKSCPTKSKIQGTDMSLDEPLESEDSSSEIAAASDRNSPVPQSGEELDDPPSVEPEKAENTESSSSEVSAAGPSTSVPVNVTVASCVPNSTVIPGKPVMVGSTTTLPCVLPSNVRQVILGQLGGVPRHQMMVKGPKLIRVVSTNAPMLTTLPVHSVKALQANPNATALVLQQLYNLNKLPAQLINPNNTVRQVKLPMGAISSQTLSGVTAQPPVVLPQGTHTITNSFSGLAQTLNFAEGSNQSEVKPHTNVLIPATSVVLQTSSTDPTTQSIKFCDPGSESIFKDGRSQHNLLAVTNMSLESFERFINNELKERKIEHEDSIKTEVSTQNDQDGDESVKPKKSPKLEIEGDTGTGGTLFKIQHTMDRSSNKVGESSMINQGVSSQERPVHNQSSGTVIVSQPSLSSAVSGTTARMVLTPETMSAVNAILNRERALQSLRTTPDIIGADGETLALKQEMSTPPPTPSSSSEKKCDIQRTTSSIMKSSSTAVTSSNGDPKTRKPDSDLPGITRLCDLQHYVELAHNGETTRNQSGGVVMKPSPLSYPESDASHTIKHSAKVQFVQKIIQPTSQMSAQSKVVTQPKPLSLSSPLTYSNAKRTYQMSADYYIKTAKAKQDLENASLESKIKQQQKEKELRLQKSLSEECEDLGVDAPRPSDLFPDTLLLETLPFDSSAADASCSQNVDSNDPFPCSDVRSADSTSDSMEGLQSSAVNPPRHLGNIEQLRYGKSSKSCLRFSGTMKKYSNAKTHALRTCSPSADTNGSKNLPCNSNESPFSTSSGEDSFNAGPSNSLSSPIGEPFERSQSTTKSQDSLLSVVQHRGSSHQTYGKRIVQSKEINKINQVNKPQELESRPFASVSHTFKRVGQKLDSPDVKDKNAVDSDGLLLSEKGETTKDSTEEDDDDEEEEEEEEERHCLRGHKRKLDENQGCKRKRRLTRCTRSLSGETTNDDEDDDSDDECHKSGGCSSDSNWSASSPALSESSPSEMKSGGECELTRRSSRRGSVKKNCPCCNGAPERNQKGFKKGSNGKSISKSGGHSTLKKR